MGEYVGMRYYEYSSVDMYTTRSEMALVQNKYLNTKGLILRCTGIL